MSLPAQGQFCNTGVTGSVRESHSRSTYFVSESNRHGSLLPSSHEIFYCYWRGLGLAFPMRNYAFILPGWLSADFFRKVVAGLVCHRQDADLFSQCFAARSALPSMAGLSGVPEPGEQAWFSVCCRWHQCQIKPGGPAALPVFCRLLAMPKISSPPAGFALKAFFHGQVFCSCVPATIPACFSHCATGLRLAPFQCV